MRPSLSVASSLAVLAIVALSSPARAIDCRKATTSIDRMVCADERLQKADAAMGAAYADLLKATDDAEIRAMVVAGQKRWLAKRDEQLGHLDEDQDPLDEETRRNIVLDAIEARTRNLSLRAADDPKLPRQIASAMAQRRFAARFTGGPFAGFATTCDFLPGGNSYSYGCFATQRYQNHDRVCSLTEDWASGSVSETRSVGQVVDGTLRNIATCSIGGGEGPDCPADGGGTGAGEGWKRVAAAEADGEAPPAPPLPRLDAEVETDDAAPWLLACLADPAYPPAEAMVGGERKP